MKKKSLLTMVLALTLVGAVGIGATLAYLSDATETLTNTFTVGSGIGVKQDEAIWDDTNDVALTDRTEEGNDYTDIQPGDVLAKDPTATVLANSSDCYVFMQLSGADELAAQQFSFSGFSADWVKVADEDGNDATTLDGLYCYVNADGTYKVVEKDAADQALTALFTTVTYSLDAAELAEGASLSDVTIKTCAVQADNMTEADALAAAQDVIK